ncbi:hypothetical protein YTPLAS18_27850 [Nitrospira sp.]|nr:hypothetical protein YTPLAS18_27850 [Nitrospira sp.]
MVHAVVSRRTGTWLLVGALCGLLLGCGGMMHGDRQSVTVFTDPPEAAVLVDGRVHLTSPGRVTLSRNEDHTARVEKDGYAPVDLRIERSMSNWEYANAACLIFIYWCVKSDRENGSYWTFDDEVHVDLSR